MPVEIRSTELIASLAKLDQLTNWEQKPREGMRVGLEPMLDLTSRLGNPHQAFRVIHVAGTKGKSSTCALLAAGLTHAGYKVGRYSSPHVEHISERITLNGVPIGEDELAEALNLSLDSLQKARVDKTAGQDATWFDVLTTTAFLVFQQADIDWAVIETGLGGRLDSTNIVNSDVAVITNIGLEHVEVLGNTRAAIAFEKAGIIKPNTLVVTALSEADEAGSVIQLRAEELASAVVRPIIPTAATLLERNVLLASAVFDALGQRYHVQARLREHRLVSAGGWLLDPDTISAAQLPGRLETLTVKVERYPADVTVHVVLDGAHVPFNLAAVMADLARMEEFRNPCIAVISIAEDKDTIGLLKVLARYAISIIFTTVGGRSRSPLELKEVADALGLKATTNSNPQDAYRRAIETAAQSGAWVLVTGSLHLVGAISRS